MKILLISNDKEFANNINHEFKEAQCELHYAADGKTGLKDALEKQFDIIMLDWEISKAGGQRILQQLRERRNLTPILMITSNDSMWEVIASLNSGADACEFKSIEIRVLLARIKALIRRSEWGRGTEISYANIRLDPVLHKVWRGDTEIWLSTKEYDLLHYLMINPEQVITRAMIADNAWHCIHGSVYNVINVYINYLRKKIYINTNQKLIHTNSLGYIFKTELQNKPYIKVQDSVCATSGQNRGETAMRTGIPDPGTASVLRQSREPNPNLY